MIEGNPPAEQNDDGIALCRDEAKHENILASTVITLWSGLSQWTFCVKDYFLVLGAHKVINNMRRRCISSGIAEPLGANKTFDDARG